MHTAAIPKVRTAALTDARSVIQYDAWTIRVAVEDAENMDGFRGASDVFFRLEAPSSGTDSTPLVHHMSEVVMNCKNPEFEPFVLQRNPQVDDLLASNHSLVRACVVCVVCCVSRMGG